ncbi:MAG: TIM barrel protein [Microthrixaceae bacterium]
MRGRRESPSAARSPLRSGMCSITMRRLTPDEVVTLAERAGLGGIEWGADGHVPPGDLALARSVGRTCADAGLAVASYGTYLGIAPFDDPAAPPGELSAVLDTAEALGAPLIRVWAAFGIESDAPQLDRAAVVATTAAITDAAARRGLGVALEFHPGTLTHTAAGARSLLGGVDHPALRTHWQPDPALAPDGAVAELALVADRLAYLHVFAWGPGGIDERHALADGVDLWLPALRLAADAPPLPASLAAAVTAPEADPAPSDRPRHRFCLLEYVAGDGPEQLVADAATLNAWIARLGQPTASTME